MAADPTTYYLTQGVLGVTCVVLAATLFYIYRTLTKKIDDKEAEIKGILEAWRLETKTTGQDTIEVMKGNSQSLFYLADKIQVGKEKDPQRGPQ